jgi:hydroxymethylpyrimidine pyrophosphatase-like HAD family hydrolase
MTDPIISLIAIDNDGCLTRGENSGYDLHFVDLMRDYAQRAKAAPADPMPEFTFITGRPQPFVECMQKMFQVDLPAIFENGAGLDHGGSVVERNPRIDDDAMAMLADAKKLLDGTVMREIPSFFQPGKDYSATVIARNADDRPRLWDACLELHQREKPGVAFVRAMRGTDVVVDGVDKGSGLEWLASTMGLTADRIAGIGDSAGDVPFLKLCKWSGAPANATDDVHSIVDYSSPHEAEAGVLDILERVTRMNREGGTAE